MPLSLSGAIREIIVNPAFDVEWIVEKYTAWVKERTYLVLGKNVKSDSFSYVKEDLLAVAVKHSKRGNDVYARRVRNRFKGLKVDDEVRFFDETRGGESTCCLFVTLTYDVKRCSFVDAWRNISAEWNRFMSNIRVKFGPASTIRTFESFKNGYPHIHALLLFDEMWFKCFKDHKGVWRINLKSFIADYWHSHVDVKAMYYLQGALTYISKYVRKCSELVESEIKVVRTLALSWIFRKRSFSVSGSFREKLHDLIVGLHNSKRIVAQSTLSGALVPNAKWFVLCRSVLGEDILILENEYWVELSKEQLNLLPLDEGIH